jgi:hypothetical protein
MSWQQMVLSDGSEEKGVLAGCSEAKIDVKFLFDEQMTMVTYI